MFFVYVLFSEKNGRFYTGQTANLSNRLQQHNLGLSKSTRNGVPWRLVHSEAVATRSEAMQRERYLKSGLGRDELHRLLANTEASNLLDRSPH